MSSSDTNRQRPHNSALMNDAERLHLIEENVRDYAIFTLNPAGYIASWNLGARRILGYEETDVLGQSGVLFFTPEDRLLHKFEQEMHLAHETGRTEEERWHLRKDGSRFWANGILTALYDAQGELRGYAKILREVIEQNQQSWRERRAAFGAEVGLALNRHQTLATNLQACAQAMVYYLDAAFARIWTLNPETNVLELQASAGIYTHLDGPHSRVPVGQFKIGLIAQERKPHLTNAVVGDPRVGDQEWAVREGMVSFAGYPLIVSGQVVGVMAMFAREVIREDTLNALAQVSDTMAQTIERKRAEQALRESEELLRITLRSIGDAVIASDADGNVRFMNPVAEELTGWRQAEAIGHGSREVFRIVNEDTRLEVESPLIRAIAENRIVGLANHTVLLSRDGKEWPVEDSGAPIRDEEGTITGAVLVFREVTARRKTESERNKNLMEIEALNVRLRRAMTETHHRVKNNLQLISFLIDMQRGTGRAFVPMEEFVKLGQNVSALGVIHDVLTQEAKSDGAQNHLSAKDVLEKLIEMLSQTIGQERSLICTLEDAPMPGRLATSLALITNELISNAMKHGKGEIAIRFRVEERQATLEVLDDGPGFPEGFDPTQAANTGLELIESVVRWDLRGELCYRNRPEGGARVVLSFPIPE